MYSLLSAPGGNGGTLPFLQPKAGSVVGSPFTVTSAVVVSTPALKASAAVFIGVEQNMHFAINGVPSTNNLRLLSNVAWQILPLNDGDIISFIAVTTTGKVYVELARTTT